MLFHPVKNDLKENTTKILDKIETELYAHLKPLGFETRLKTYTGITAQIIQYEISHCNGTLV